MTRPLFILALVRALLGCSTVPSDLEYRETSAVLPGASSAFKVDARAQFRSIFCALLQTQNNCAQYLWRLADESKPVMTPNPLPEFAPGMQVYMVGGAFSGCFGDASIAFKAPIARLLAAGVNIHAVPVISRSGAERNAQIITQTIQKTLQPGGGPVVLVGYSKGSVDILHFLAAEPELAKQVDAVVSIAGPINGSHLADQGAWIYDVLLSKTFNDRCDVGDGGIVDSLRTDYRRQWNLEHPLAENIHFYSILAFTTREHIARSLRIPWQMLAAGDKRNDGQLTLAEGTVAGSTLLAYANTDHWGVALEIERELPFLAHRDDSREYPRDVLFESVLRIVSTDILARVKP